MTILERTFRHFKGISAHREIELWRREITTWEQLQFHLSPQRNLFGDNASAAPIVRQIEESRTALVHGDIAYFGQQLERKEHFRIALAFPKETLFLDIETTGLSRYYDHITAIGWSLDADYGFYVKGQNDAEFRRAITSAKIIVTFNGSIFDLPFIQQEFPDVHIPKVHIDLRFLSKRSGLTGGQKELETLLGIERPADVFGLTGESAPVLWHRYRRGDIDSLRMLLKYNHSDIRGMKSIFDIVARRLLDSYGLENGKISVPSFSSQEHPKAQQYVNRRIGRVLKPFIGSTKPSIQIRKLSDKDSPPLKIVGIDLSGSEGKASGWCILDGREASTLALHKDEELVAHTVGKNPHIISIDSPLSLPAGRKSVEDTDPGRDKYGIVRFCERVLKRRGINVYPALIQSMQKLTARGMRLAQTFRALGYPVIESYPGAAQDILNIPRKRASLEFLERGLAEFGIRGRFIKKAVSHDELDAITSAIVGIFFWSGMYERLGEIPFGDEALIIPDLKADLLARKSTLVVGFSGALGAGKTTAAECLRDKYGFAYGRYSQIIEERVRRKKKEKTFDRLDLQIEGQLVNEKYGQRWLGQQLLTRLGTSKRIVIDGLRFPEDHAYLTEMFGSHFVHIHLVAPTDLRKIRCMNRNGEGYNFEIADKHEVEQKVTQLKPLAKYVIENSKSVGVLRKELITLCKLEEVA